MLLIALGGFAAYTAFVAGHVAPLPGEVGVVEWTNDLPRVIGAPLEVVMQLGTLPAAIGVLMGVVLLTGSKGMAPSIAVFVATVTSRFTDDIIKAIVERPRPSLVLVELHVRDHPGGFSYPSGHTTTAFALAASLVPLLPKRVRPVSFVLATGTAIARMYVGVHWPTDLVGGAALGTAIGTGAWLLADLIVANWPAPPAPASSAF